MPSNVVAIDSRQTMEDADIFCEMQTSENTQRAYRGDLQKWFNFVEFYNYSETSTVALRFKQSLEATYASSTAQRVWCTVAAYYGWLKATGRITDAPFHGIKAPKRSENEPPPVPTDEAVDKLLSAAMLGDTELGRRGSVVITLLLNGLRAQEVCDLGIESLQNHEGKWILDVVGKGDKHRFVPLTSESQQAIFDLHLNGPVSSWVVSNTSGDQLTTGAIRRYIKMFAKRAGIDEKIHPHALRHHYATRLVRAGVDVFSIQKLLGHARADTTQRYVGLDTSDLFKALMHDPRHNIAYEHSKSLIFNREFAGPEWGSEVPF